MQRLSSGLILGAVVVLALPAAAQQQPSAQPAPQWGSPEPLSINEGGWTRMGQDQWLRRANGADLAAQPLERVDLANRVSTLIELGRCTEARDTAREAGDRWMALRAREMCRTDRKPG